MRIISGIYKGRILKSPTGINEVRPTTDRAKETLFNILCNRYAIEEKTCIDLFCGTGNLGIEFISRGGSKSIFIDTDIKSVKENAALLNLGDKAEIIRSEAVRFLHNPNNNRNLDFTFADPPYKYDNYTELISSVSAYRTILVLEHDKNLIIPEDFGIKVFLRKKIGVTNFTFFDFKNNI
ncbi:MAG: RsmD family RNA methyltransferase [Ignavibacteriae bacterium]|nr:RsmD family RNA methyltransferase [Ignavibacteriota bacterium]